MLCNFIEVNIPVTLTSKIHHLLGAQLCPTLLVGWGKGAHGVKFLSACTPLPE